MKILAYQSTSQETFHACYIVYIHIYIYTLYTLMYFQCSSLLIPTCNYIILCFSDAIIVHWTALDVLKLKQLFDTKFLQKGCVPRKVDFELCLGTCLEKFSYEQLRGKCHRLKKNLMEVIIRRVQCHSQSYPIKY
jgi:hypothetical protein